MKPARAGSKNVVPVPLFYAFIFRDDLRSRARRALHFDAAAQHVSVALVAALRAPPAAAGKLLVAVLVGQGVAAALPVDAVHKCSGSLAAARRVLPAAACKWVEPSLVEEFPVRVARKRSAFLAVVLGALLATVCMWAAQLVEPTLVEELPAGVAHK